MQGKKQQLEPDMEQQTGSKLGKEYVRLYIVTVLQFSSIQSLGHVLFFATPWTAARQASNSTWTMNFQMFKLDLEKAETRDLIVNMHWITENAREF